MPPIGTRASFLAADADGNGTVSRAEMLAYLQSTSPADGENLSSVLTQSEEECDPAYAFKEQSYGRWMFFLATAKEEDRAAFIRVCKLVEGRPVPALAAAHEVVATNLTHTFEGGGVDPHPHPWTLSL